jgi:hypothetical protein
LSVSIDQLRDLIIQSLHQQGFRLDGNHILPPLDLTKERLRVLHADAVRHRRERSKKHLAKQETALLRRFASGEEVVPERISPALVEVLPDSEDELLFRYATLHWSVPVSSGYGRRIRFLVLDEHTEKLIGLFC